MKASYPDVSEILSAKVARRQALAALSWEEKVAIIEQMRQLLPKTMWKDKVTDNKRTYRDEDTRQRHEDGQAG